MTVPVYALVTRAEVKAYKPMTGTSLDGLIDDEIARWSAEIERHLDRRLVFRAPTDDDDAIVVSRTLVDETIPGGSITQPNSDGRILVVTVTDADASVTAGTVTVTGTVGGVAGTTEVFDLSQGLVLYGVKFFTAISAIVVAVTGEGAGDTIKIGTSLGYVEYHSPQPGALELWPIEWPVRQMLEVNEDSDRAYGASTKLAATAYQLADRERLVRMDSDPAPWESAYRAVRLTYSAGYFSPANVPGPIKQVALELIAWSIGYGQRQLQGQASHSDATGSMAFSGPPMITSGMTGRLAAYRNRRVAVAERDFDLEAA